MSNITDLSKLFRGLVDDMDAEDVNRFQVPQMTQQQTPQVQIPMAPQQSIPLQETSQELAFQQNMDPSKLMPVDTAFNQQYTPESFDNIGVVPPVQMNIPQPTMPSAAPLPNSDNFVLRPPEQVVLGESAQGLPESYTSAGYFPEVPQLDGNVPQVTEPTVEREPSFFDNMRAPRPSYLPSGFEEDISSQETLDKTYEFANWVKDNPAEAAAAGVSLYPAARIGSAVTSGAAKVVGKLSNFTRGKLPKRFRDFFGNTKTVPGKSTTTKVQREGQPGVYDPLRTTKEVFTVSPTKTGLTAAGLYAGSEAGEALFPDIPKPEGSNIPAVEPVGDPSLLRPDGTTKSTKGFLGPIEGNDNSLRTELSIGVDFGNGEVLVPSMIPGLTAEEIEVLRNLPEGSLPPQSIIDKAKAHAEKRIANNLSPFYQDGEEDLVEQDAANAEAEKEITVKEAETVVKTIEPTLKKDADKVIESLGEKEDDEPEESFLKRVWNGVSGFFKEQLDDPKVRRTLFAYIASRAVGYDGVTFAGQVLENEWKQEAAQKKQDFELEKIYGKEAAAQRKKLIDDQSIDFSKTAEIYDTVNQRNLTGSFSKNGQLISLDNPEAFGLTPENRVVSVAALRQMTDGQYTLGKGDTSQDIQKELTSYVSNNLSNTIDSVVSNVAQRRGLESKDEKALDARIRGSLTTSQLEGATTLFTSMLPANTNYDTPEMRLALNNGIEQYAKAIADGRSSAGSKQLAGFFEMQQIKSDSRNRISDGFLAIPKLEGATDKTGINVFSKASNKVKNLKSAFADYNKMDPNRINKTAMWSNLERLYNEQEAAQGTAFTKHWLGASDASVKKGNEEAASPQLLWVMSLGNTSSKFNAGSLKDIVPKL